MGWEVLPLPDPDHRDVWALAHPDPDGLGDGWTRAALLRAAAEAGVDDAGPIVEELLGRGALVEVAREPAAASAFAGAYRLEPLLAGLGRTADEPLDGIGVPGLLVAARVTPRVFELWQWAHLWPDLWAACRGLAEVAVESGQDDPGEIDPHRVLTAALDAVQILLSRGVAYLDARRTVRPQVLSGAASGAAPGGPVGWSS